MILLSLQFVLESSGGQTAEFSHQPHECSRASLVDGEIGHAFLCWWQAIVQSIKLFLTHCSLLFSLYAESILQSYSTLPKNDNNMPVPKRRSRSLAVSPTVLLSNIFDIDFIFQRTKTLLYYGFTPMVIYFGMTTEPPAGWFDLINIF